MIKALSKRKKKNWQQLSSIVNTVHIWLFFNGLLEISQVARRSRHPKTEGLYVQNFSDEKILYPNFCAFSLRLLSVHQTFVLFAGFWVLMSRFLVADQIFVCSYTDFWGFVILVQIFVRSSGFRALSRLSCLSVDTFVSSCLIFLFLLVQIFLRSPDFCRFTLKFFAFVGLPMFPNYVTLNARLPLVRSFLSLDILASVWGLNLG